ncbi:class II aldolase/adducin family protein [Streptomyces acidicola]|uniref:Class II aldolase/adducin family protein n=1 Tax=Streptomyces acidicola TaxID=2596892 RepID=A0A5N8WK02_9ACTN|nr:class II aldolase/adducin family protein [Streptomyces acidicola]MPY47442.1 class II aldolase/adducin family protein [Streptomyces acidicola]
MDPSADVAVATRALGAAGQADLVWGHVSLRDPDGRGVWMKASGWGFEEVTPRRTLLVSPEGEVLAGEGRPHLEYPIHTEIMAVRPDVGAVVHTHGPAAVTFASLGVPLLPLSHDAVPFVDPDVPRHPSGRLISDRGLGARLAASLGDGAGCLMVSHGLVTVGSDLASAVMHAVLLERACAIQLRALAAGGPMTWSDVDEVAQKRAETWAVRQLSAGYAYLCRKAFPSGVGRFSPEAPIPTE